MSEDKKFCPKCKGMIMEPAEGILISPEERVEPEREKLSLILAIFLRQRPRTLLLCGNGP